MIGKLDYNIINKSDYSSLDSKHTEVTPLLEEIIFTQEDIIHEIDTINTTSADGPDAEDGKAASTEEPLH